VPVLAGSMLIALSGSRAVQRLHALSCHVVGWSCIARRAVAAIQPRVGAVFPLLARAAVAGGSLQSQLGGMGATLLLLPVRRLYWLVGISSSSSRRWLPGGLLWPHRSVVVGIACSLRTAGTVVCRWHSCNWACP
jgi:hypothetical protein